MKFYNIFFTIILLFVSGQSYADEYKGSCTSKDPNFERCLDDELIKYDQELNSLYTGFIKRFHHKKLKETERLWIKFKESDCDYMASEIHEGLYYQFIYKTCLINKTKARIADLKRSFFYKGWFNED